MKRNKNDKDILQVMQRQLATLEKQVSFLANSRTTTLPIKEGLPPEIVPGELFVTSEGKMRWSRDTTMQMDVLAGMIIPLVINFPSLPAHSGNEVNVSLVGTMWEGHVMAGDWLRLHTRPGVVDGSRAINFYTEPNIAINDTITMHGYNADTVTVDPANNTFRFFVQRPGAASD